MSSNRYNLVSYCHFSMEFLRGYLPSLRLGVGGKIGTSKHAAASKGWVRYIRQTKNIAFLQINDGSCLKNLQVVASHQIPKTSFGSCIEVKGKLQKSTHEQQNVELKSDSISIIGECDALEFPLKANKNHTADYLRQFLHLRCKTNRFGSLLRVRNAATQGLHHYFQKEGFCQVHTPILTANDCEGAGEIFQVEPAEKSQTNELDKDEKQKRRRDHFFTNRAFLTVSSQLHLEVVTGALNKAYTISPTFRAENSYSRHHLSEFYMVEAEIAFTENTEDLMQTIEGSVKHACNHVLSLCGEDFNWYMDKIAPKEHQSVVRSMIDNDFIRLSYTEAISILKEKDQFVTPVYWGCDLHKEHEKFLVDYCGRVPVFITDFPADLKPFYARVNKDMKTVAAVDLLAPGVGELVGGSLREESYDKLKERTDKLNLSDTLNWYLELRRYGSCPHGGFGIGFERLIQSILGIHNIKDATIFPRSSYQCKM